MVKQKRARLEIIRDILKIIKENNNSIRGTPLLRKTNLSSSRFKEYYADLLDKSLVIESKNVHGEKFVSLTDKGFKFLDKYQAIVSFIDEFEL